MWARLSSFWPFNDERPLPASDPAPLASTALSLDERRDRGRGHDRGARGDAAVRPRGRHRLRADAARRLARAPQDVPRPGRSQRLRARPRLVRNLRVGDRPADRARVPQSPAGAAEDVRPGKGPLDPRNHRPAERTRSRASATPPAGAARADSKQRFRGATAAGRVDRDRRRNGRERRRRPRRVERRARAPEKGSAVRSEPDHERSDRSVLRLRSAELPRGRARAP